ncbi:hypothetical protein FF2_006113 [Malus domestica]
MTLLSVIIEYYDVKMQCFVLPSGCKLVFTLQDVLYITGLPIDRRAVSRVDNGGEYLTRTYLEEDFVVKEEALKFTWLRDKFQVVPPEIGIDGPELLPYVRTDLVSIKVKALKLMGLISEIQLSESGSDFEVKALKLMVPISEILLVTESISGFNRVKGNGTHESDFGAISYIDPNIDETGEMDGSDHEPRDNHYKGDDDSNHGPPDNHDQPDHGARDNDRQGKQYA